MTDKMGRNPFATKGADKKPLQPAPISDAPPEVAASPVLKTAAKTRTKKSKPAPGGARRKEAHSKSLKDWKLERFSVLRIDGDGTPGSKPRVTFLDLRLKNAHWSGPRTLEIPVPFFPARWLIVRLISAKISSV